MDELELLKKDWKKQDAKYPKLSYDQIYKMLWKKSSSIVKWIFVISLIEFLFWGVLNIFFADNEYWKEMERLHLKDFTIAVYVINYLITIYFIYCFYTNYRRISSTDDAVTLMDNILKTRKTVKYYIGYILISTGIITLVYSYFMISDHAYTKEFSEISKYTFETLDWIKFIGIGLIILTLLLGFLWLFYRLIYGILLKKLYGNYKELKKLEV